MKKILKNYKMTIMLLGGIIIGAIIGLIFGDKATILSPLGNLYLNLLLITIVPLIFLTITTSFAKVKSPKRIGKILTNIIIVFVITSIISLLVGLASTYFVKLVDVKDTTKIVKDLNLETNDIEKVELNILERTVDAISTNDFVNLLSKDNILALVIVSLLVGVSIMLSKEKAEPFYEFLISAKEVLLKFIGITSYYAPIGLGCYMASLVGSLGKDIAAGYLFTFVYYLIISVLFMAVIYTLFAYIAGGKKGIIKFWQNIIPVTVTALATCSSAASIPANIECTKKIGVSDDIADTTISLGTSFHKDGSTIGSVFKIMFLVCLFKTNIYSISSVGTILLVALVSTLLVTAVPVGGGTISETMILVLMGYPLGVLPVLTIIATIIDAPATVLNVLGDTASSMLVSRMVDGKNWLNRKNNLEIN